MEHLKRGAIGIILNGLALYAVLYFLPEIVYTGGWTFFIVGGVLLGFLNWIVKPLIKVLSLPFIFITGGVVSSLGKGLSAASLGALLQSHGYTVKLRKLDPYLNVDPGTMNPIQHGEVFVLDDGS